MNIDFQVFCEKKHKSIFFAQPFVMDGIRIAEETTILTDIGLFVA